MSSTQFLMVNPYYDMSASFTDASTNIDYQANASRNFINLIGDISNVDVSNTLYEGKTYDPSLSLVQFVKKTKRNFLDLSVNTMLDNLLYWARNTSGSNKFPILETGASGDLSESQPTLSLYETIDNYELTSTIANQGDAYHMAMSKDGKRLIAGGQHSATELYLWNETLGTRGEWQYVNNDPNLSNWGDLAINADGSRFAIDNGESNNRVSIYEWHLDGTYTLLDDIINSARPGEQWESGKQWGTYLSMSADGQTVAFSAFYSGANNSYKGHVEVWGATDSTGTSWVQLGSDIPDSSQLAVYDHAGYHGVELNADGTRVVIAVPNSSTTVARVFDYNASTNTWHEKAGIAKSEVKQVSWMRLQLSGDGMRLAFASMYIAVGNAEEVIIFDYDANNNVWNKIGSPITSPATTNIHTNGFGRDTAMTSDGTLLVIGARSYNTTEGAAWVYAWDGNDWSSVGTILKSANNGETHHLGSGLVVSDDGQTIVIGANGGNAAGNEIVTFQAILK